AAARDAVPQPQMPLFQVVELPPAPLGREHHCERRVLGRLDIFDRIHYEADSIRCSGHAQFIRRRLRAVPVTVVMVSEPADGGFAINMLKPPRERNLSL